MGDVVVGLLMLLVGVVVTGALTGRRDGSEIDGMFPDKVSVAAEAIPTTASVDKETIVMFPAFLADGDATRTIFIDHLFPGGAPTRQEVFGCGPTS